MTVMMTSAQVVETSVNVTNNSPSRDYSHPDDQTTQTTKISVSSGTLSVILSASGLATSLTGFGAAVGIPLGALGGVCGGVSVVCGMASKILSHKVSKHEQTVALAKAKANTIRDLVSKALQDNMISDQEYSLVLAEVDKFEQLKLEIHQRSRKDTEKK